MSRSHWLMGAALVLFIAAPAMSQQPADPPQANAGGGAIHIEMNGQPSGFEFQQVGPNVTYRRLGAPNSTAVIGNFPPSKYWLGILCSPVPPALRSHLTLPEKQGLLATSVSKDSPAAKAGIMPYDILLRVGGKPLADAHELQAAIETAKESKLKIDLIHGGKPKTIEVTPAKRPAPTASESVQTPQQADWNTIQNWVESMMPNHGATGAQPSLQFRFVHPGAILPNGALGPRPLPTNMSVAVTKEGNEPAKIKVQRGNDKWEITEKETDKLPADVRPFVEQMLGHGMVGVVGGAMSSGTSGGMSGSGTFQLPMPPPGMMQPRPFPGNPNQQMIEKRFDEMNRRMDQLFKMMEELTEEHGQHAAPEHKGEK